MKEVKCSRCQKVLFKRHDKHLIHKIGNWICNDCFKKETKGLDAEILRQSVIRGKEK